MALPVLFAPCAMACCKRQCPQPKAVQQKQWMESGGWESPGGRAVRGRPGMKSHSRELSEASGLTCGIWKVCALYTGLWHHMCPLSIRGGGSTCDLESGGPVAGLPLLWNSPLQAALLEVSLPPAHMLRPTSVREHVSGLLLAGLAVQTANRFRDWRVAAGRLMQDQNFGRICGIQIPIIDFAFRHPSWACMTPCTM